MDHDDFDIEMGDVETFPANGDEDEDILQIDDDILPADDAQEPGEVDESAATTAAGAEDTTILPTKVHLRGLDTMTPDDIKAYFNQHSGGARFDRIEWIDDTSANLVFGSDSAAADALASLAAIEVANPGALPPRELVPAKPYSAKPDTTLHVRFAVASDRKAAGAAARSRFYLFNPEYERQERGGRRRGGGGGGRDGRYRERDDYDRRHQPRRRRDETERYEYDDETAAPFDVNLYDDDEASLARRKPRNSRRPSRSRSRSRPRSGGSGAGRPNNSGKELFPDLGKRRERRARGRSASPLRGDRDGDVGMDGGGGGGRDETAAATSAAVRNRDKAREIKELFPGKLAASGGGKVAQMDRVDKVDVVSKRLSDRITPRPQAGSEGGGALNIRGMAKTHSNVAGTGISIKGRATAKELFPEKLGNAGKELFADRLEGRGRPRRKAEDSFI